MRKQLLASFVGITLILAILPVGVYADNPSITLQAADKDTYIEHLVAEDACYGDEPYIEISNYVNNRERALLEFDLSDIPAGVSIVSATLELYYYTYSETNPMGLDIAVYKLTRTDWLEGTTENPSTSGATWNDYKIVGAAHSTWTTEGGDYVTSSPSGGSEAVPASYGWISFDVYYIVADAWANTNPAEFIVKFDNEGTPSGYSYMSFLSNEYATASLRPKLTVEYSTLPVIVTHAASSISATTARLNSMVDSDGGDDIEVRFGWGETPETAIENYDNYDTVTGTWNTGEHPYLDVSDLLPDTTYYFRVEGENAYGSDLGYELDFTTSNDIADVSSLRGVPSSDSVSLSWDIAEGASQYMIRYSTDTYPTGSVSHDIDYGSDSVFYTISADSDVAWLDSTHFVVVWDTGSTGFASIGTVAGDTISWGNDYQFEAARANGVEVAALSASQFVVIYRDYGDSKHGNAVVGNVTGTTISYGTEYTFVNSDNAHHIDVKAIDSTHIIVTHSGTAGGSDGYGVVGTVTGDVIAFGSDYSFSPTIAGYNKIAMLDATHFVVAYQEQENGDNGQCVIGSIAGASLSFGAKQTFEADMVYSPSPVALDSTHITVSYEDSHDSYKSKSIVGVVSGDTINWGIPYVFDETNERVNEGIYADGLDSTHFVIAWKDCDYDDSTQDGRAVVATVDDVGIIFGDTFTWDAGTITQPRLAAYGTSTFVISYYDIVVSDAKALIGIITETGSNPTGGNLAYMGSSTSTTHEDLSPGTTYYYAIWGESGGTYSDYPAILMLTTSARIEPGDTLPPPSEPTSWMAAPDYERLEGLGYFYDGVNGSADVIGMPRATFWFLSYMGLAVFLSLLFYLKIRQSNGAGTMTIVVLTILLFGGLVIGLLPFWIPLISVIALIGLAISHREVAKG